MYRIKYIKGEEIDIEQYKDWILWFYKTKQWDIFETKDDKLFRKRPDKFKEVNEPKKPKKRHERYWVRETIGYILW